MWVVKIGKDGDVASNASAVAEHNEDGNDIREREM